MDIQESSDYCGEKECNSAIASVFILLAGASILLISESNDPSQIEIDGNISDWKNIEITETDSLQTENSNIDITEISMNLILYIFTLYQTKEPLFIGKADTLRIFVDTIIMLIWLLFPE